MIPGLEGSGESSHCGLCGLLWTDHERDEQIGPMGVRAWVCRLPQQRYDALLSFLEDERNWYLPGLDRPELF